MYRRVYDFIDGELQLRVAVPTGAVSSMEVPGVGKRELTLRDRLILDYHNSVLGGHLGRDKTQERLERDWWWPGMYKDVVVWCKHCLSCQKENTRSSLSAWTRTEFYDRPFRVIQFDLVVCAERGGSAKEVGGNPGSLTGAKYILSAICLFSRFVWFIALLDKTSESVAKALLERVFMDMAMFPVLLRSDNDPTFMSEVVAYMNRMVNILHVTGSSYHPQSQGVVENIQRTLVQILRMMVQENPERWEEMLPYCQCIVRVMPMPALGGRSPYQVVTGLQPRLPRVVSTQVPIVKAGVSEYVEDLLGYLRETYQSVVRHQRDLREEDEAEARSAGSLSAELHVGDLVMVKLPPTVSRKGPNRFQPRVRDQIWRIKKKFGPHTFELVDSADPAITAEYRYSAENLIKVELPEIPLDPGQRRTVEVYDNTTARWRRFRIERFGIDSRVFLTPLRQPLDGGVHEDAGPGRWVDLTQELYRWIV